MEISKGFLRKAITKYIAIKQLLSSYKNTEKALRSYVSHYCKCAQNDLGTDMHVKHVPFIKHYGSGRAFRICEWTYTTYHLRYALEGNTLYISLYDGSGLRRAKEEILFDALCGLRIEHQRLYHPDQYDPLLPAVSSQTYLASASSTDAEAYAIAFFLFHGIFHPAVYKLAIRRMLSDGGKRFRQLQTVMEAEFYCEA